MRIEALESQLGMLKKVALDVLDDPDRDSSDMDSLDEKVLASEENGPD